MTSHSKTFKMKSKLLDKIVEVEILNKFAFIEGCRYSLDEIVDMSSLSKSERRKIHIIKMLKTAKFAPEEIRRPL